MVKHLPVMRETQVRSLGWEDPLEKEMATHSSTLAWKIPWTEEPGRLQSMGSQRVRHNWATSLVHWISQFSSVQSLSCLSHCQPRGLQHARLPCLSPTPGVYSNSSPSSRWCHPMISSSVVPFSSCLQSLPASWSFPMSQFFASGGQSIGVSALASFLPKNTQGWSPLEWTDWISLQSKVCSRVLSNTTVQKHQFFSTQPSSWLNSHIHTWLLKKTLALTIWTFVSKVMSLLFIMWSLS